MKILLSELPKSDWWGKGMPQYANNWMMAQHKIPRPEVVRDAHRRLVETLQPLHELDIIPFPEKFDNGLYKHDFIFLRDSLISSGKGDVVISNFSERGREDEALFMQQYLKSYPIRLHQLSSDAYAEGGEFLYLPKENLLFAGVNRNNEKGVKEVADYFNVTDTCIVRTSAFHLDTNMCMTTRKDGSCAMMLACLSTITNADEVKSFCISHHIDLVDLLPIDGMGSPDAPGTLATNSLALPGLLVGCAAFQTPGVEDRLKQAGIRHIVVSLHDLTFSGGSVHCLTNEL